jgi:hypothetical protein
VDRDRDELEDQGTEAEPKEPPVDGPGTGSQDSDLGDTSQDSPGRE